MSRVLQVRKGAYQDSVSLMQVSRDLGRQPGVSRALVAMATELNLDLLADMGFDTPADTSPNDLFVAIEADDQAAVDAAVAELEAALVRRPAGGASTSAGPLPPTVRAAAARADADLVLISTPGRYAAIEAADALDSGLDVMVFSDNVTVEAEVALKERATERGLLVMGPDCGTAVVDGVGLGFANVVRPGPVGIVAASGTGAQHVLSLLDGADVGVKHCLGVGGRDLSAAVGGRSTLTALDRLAADDDVTTIVVISKPPAAEVADKVVAHAETLGKPVRHGYLGRGHGDITALVQGLVESLGLPWTEPARWGSPPDTPPPDTPPSDAPTSGRHAYLRGLFAGGTLCDEAMLIAADELGPVYSNIPLETGWDLDPDLTSREHTFIDFGDDALTVGRPHPMIDPTLRLLRLERELADRECAVVLLDVVLGHGAHADPAADLVEPISRSTKPVIISLIGTRDDPQGLQLTATRLADAGAVVHASNAAATREALNLLTKATT